MLLKLLPAQNSFQRSVNMIIFPLSSLFTVVYVNKEKEIMNDTQEKKVA
jgi:hypothetical protein